MTHKRVAKESILSDMFRPEIIDLTKMSEMTNQERLQHAFDAAQRKFGIEPLLDAEDVDVEKPDEKSVITYVSSLYDVFPKVSVITILLKITICENHYLQKNIVLSTIVLKAHYFLYKQNQTQIQKKLKWCQNVSHTLNINLI